MYVLSAKYRTFEIVGLTETIVVNIFVLVFTGTAEEGSKRGLKKVGILNYLQLFRVIVLFLI